MAIVVLPLPLCRDDVSMSVVLAFGDNVVRFWKKFDNIALEISQTNRKPSGRSTRSAINTIVTGSAGVREYLVETMQTKNKTHKHSLYLYLSTCRLSTSETVE